jgi:hypothetical protein
MGDSACAALIASRGVDDFEHRLSDGDLVASAERLRSRDTPAVEERSVGRTEILKDEYALGGLADPGVQPR